MLRPMAIWRVLPHRPIERLTENLWRVEGDLDGMPLKRVMTVAKRADGALVIHNAMALEDAAMREIEAWGEVAFVIVPSGYHRMDAPAFHERYPKAKILCPSGARKKVEQVVPVSGTYEDFPADEAVRFEMLDGLRGAEGVMIVRSKEGTSVVFTDALFNMPHPPGFTGFVFKHVTASSGGPRVSRVTRLFLVKDNAAFRASLERLAQISDLRRIIVAHHETVEVEPSRVLLQVASTL
jgi:hypothetical protein